jgi:hypothetical protein
MQEAVYMFEESSDESLSIHDTLQPIASVRSENNLIVSPKSDDKPILQSIDNRIAKADEPREIVLWTKVREEIIRQNETLEEPRHRRRLATWQLYFKMSFSIVAFATGVTLLIKGFMLLAPLIIGAGLFALAPEFVMAYLTKEKGEQNEQR